MDAVKVNNLCFSYRDLNVFDNVHFAVKSGSFTTVLGSGGSGKSTLFRIFCGDFDYDGSILIFGKPLSYALEFGYIGIISKSYKFRGTVFDMFVQVLRDSEKFMSNAKKEIDRVVKKFSIHDILDFSFSDLSYKNKVLVMIAMMILKRPKVIIIDNCLNCLDDDYALYELKRLNKKSTIINITNNSEECIFGSDVLFLDDATGYKVKKMSEDDFSSHGIDAPFIISLSSKLKFYGVISNNYVNMERLVDDLWQ